jgi:hypothetical protein
MAKQAKKTAKKPVAKSAPKNARREPQRHRRNGRRIFAVKIFEVVPATFKIGGNTTEVEIRGCDLDEPGLQAVILAPGSTTVSDAAITVEQPLPDDVTAQKFPITITVQDNAQVGDRAVAMTLNGILLKPILDKALSIIN